MKQPKENQDRVPLPPCGAEVIAIVCALITGIVIVFCAVAIVVGSSYQPSEGWLSAVLADDLALVWITLGSTAHFVFVPAFCIAVALRDRRRARVGIAVPEARSVWVGYERVFLDEEGRQHA